MRINIWIPGEKLLEIDKRRGNKSRSEYLVSCAISNTPSDVYTHDLITPKVIKEVAEGVNKDQQEEIHNFKTFHSCEAPDRRKCFNPSVGLFSININDPLEGDKNWEGYLCQFHLDKARKEGADVEEVAKNEKEN